MNKNTKLLGTRTNRPTHQKNTNSVWDEKVSAGTKEFHAKGSLKAVCIGSAIIATIAGIVAVVKHRHKKDENAAKTDDKIRATHQAYVDKMAEDDNRTSNSIRKAQALSQLRLKELVRKLDMRRPRLASVITDSPKSMRKWIEGFREGHPFPALTHFPILNEIMKGTPEGFEDAMLVHLLSMFGGLCFSRVRAKFVDKTIHAPNIQVIIVGESGSGKGKFKYIYKQLFQRIIDSDRKKMGMDDKHIIQMVGLQVSNAKFFEILAHNEGVHMYSMEEELQEIAQVFGKNGKLDYNILRKAFDNGDVFKDNTVKRGVHGSFPVFYNYTFTGTPGALKSFFPEKEKEGGTARRHIISPIPEIGFDTVMLFMPERERLEEIRDQIDDWREKYCYKADDNGKELPCPEHNIELRYLFDALEEWKEEQKIMTLKGGEPERTAMSNSMTAIAFHCAIVLHMLAGEPDPNERSKRRAVKDTTLYIADYCMERYITLFGKPAPNSTEPEDGGVGGACGSHGPVKRKLTDEELQEWQPLYGTLDADGKKIGYGYIAKKLNVDKDSVRNALKRYEKKLTK